MLGAAIALHCSALAGCDQFATIGEASAEQDLPPEMISGGTDASGGSGGQGASPPIEDAAIATDSGIAIDAAIDAGAECIHPATTECDPVANIGCGSDPLAQCGVDLINPLGGHCLFFTPNVAVDCLNIFVVESCGPGHACIDGACQRLCFCDSECPIGQCCSLPLGETGFSFCGAC